jgi:ubiquinone/menaquinone biosynthesis C-methylase UbiE
MLERAAGFEPRVGTAEALPVADASLDLVFCSLLFHLLDDRRRAVAELRRGLRPGGWAAIWTLTPEHVLGYHLNPYFPSLVAVDLPRLEAPERWLRLLVEAGFPWAAEQELRLTTTSTAARLARAVRGRFISTLSLLPEAELEAGTRRLEAEAEAEPDRPVTHAQVWCLLWARR